MGGNTDKDLIVCDLLGGRLYCENEWAINFSQNLDDRRKQTRAWVPSTGAYYSREARYCKSEGWSPGRTTYSIAAEARSLGDFARLMKPFDKARQTDPQRGSRPVAEQTARLRNISASEWDVARLFR